MIFHEASVSICVRPRRSPAALCVGPRRSLSLSVSRPRRSLCRAPAFSVSGPGALRAPALSVGARHSLCRAPCSLRHLSLSVSGPRFLCPAQALSLCRGRALSVSGHGTLSVGPGSPLPALSVSRPGLSVSGPGALCRRRGTALSVSGLRGLCVGRRRSLCLCRGPAALGGPPAQIRVPPIQPGKNPQTLLFGAKIDPHSGNLWQILVTVTQFNGKHKLLARYPVAETPEDSNRPPSQEEPRLRRSLPGASAHTTSQIDFSRGGGGGVGMRVCGVMPCPCY